MINESFIFSNFKNYINIYSLKKLILIKKIKLILKENNNSKKIKMIKKMKRRINLRKFKKIRMKRKRKAKTYQKAWMIPKKMHYKRNSLKLSKKNWVK